MVVVWRCDMRLQFVSFDLATTCSALDDIYVFGISCTPFGFATIGLFVLSMPLFFRVAVYSVGYERIPVLRPSCCSLGTGALNCILKAVFVSDRWSIKLKVSSWVVHACVHTLSLGAL